MRGWTRVELKWDVSRQSGLCRLGEPLPGQALGRCCRRRSLRPDVVVTPGARSGVTWYQSLKLGRTVSVPLVKGRIQRLNSVLALPRAEPGSHVGTRVRVPEPSLTSVRHGAAPTQHIGG